MLEFNFYHSSNCLGNGADKVTFIDINKIIVLFGKLQPCLFFIIF